MTTSQIQPRDAETIARGPGLIFLVISVTALGGFLFGYDTAVISGAIGFLKLHFVLTPMGTGWAGDRAIVGCIPGSMFAGILSDRLGRKKVLLLCAASTRFPAWRRRLPRTFAEFIIARFVGGLSIGASSMICPLYIAEIAPKNTAAGWAHCFNSALSLASCWFSLSISSSSAGDEAWNARVGWRWMLGSEMLPAILFLGCSFLIPESPRWLAINNHVEKARRILAHHGAGKCRSRIERDRRGDASRKGQALGAVSSGLSPAAGDRSWPRGFRAIQRDQCDHVLRAGDFQNHRRWQRCGLHIGGVGGGDQFPVYVRGDRIGRSRGPAPLLAIGAAVQTLSLAAVGIMFATGRQGVGVLLCILAFVAAFAMAMGPIPWILISEIFPGRIRGRASSVGIFSIWVACFVVAQTFPQLHDALGSAMTFWIYGVCSLASLIFVLVLIPETKGKTLEEIDAFWHERRSEAVASAAAKADN